MKVIKAVFIFILILGVAGVAFLWWFISNKSTEELFGHYASVEYQVPVPDELLIWHFQNSNIDKLVGRSMLDSRPLVANLINLSGSVAVDNEKFEYLLSIILKKYHGDKFFPGEDCGFLDQLIMRADLPLIIYLVNHGYGSTEVERDICEKDFLVLAEQYRFKYQEAEYSRLVDLLNSEFKIMR